MNSLWLSFYNINRRPALGAQRLANGRLELFDLSKENELLSIVITLIRERGEGMYVVRLVKKAKKGNKEALLQLIMAEKDAYYKLAFTYMGNTHDAMDAMEEMIVTVI